MQLSHNKLCNNAVISAILQSLFDLKEKEKVPSSLGVALFVLFLFCFAKKRNTLTIMMCAHVLPLVRSNHFTFIKDNSFYITVHLTAQCVKLVCFNTVHGMVFSLLHYSMRTGGGNQSDSLQTRNESNNVCAPLSTHVLPESKFVQTAITTSTTHSKLNICQHTFHKVGSSIMITSGSK